MRAAEAAKIVRKAMRDAGVDPKGSVHVRDLGYITELHVDMRFIYDEEQFYEIEEAISNIPDSGQFVWEVQSFAL